MEAVRDGKNHGAPRKAEGGASSVTYRGERSQCAARSDECWPARQRRSILRQALMWVAVFASAGTTFAISTPSQGAISAGGHHVLALKADGTVWSWGANDTGQLGTNDGPARAAPAAVPGLGSVAAIVAGYGHSVVLKVDGTVWAWGDNSFAQLGDGTQVNRSSPVPITGLSNIVAVAAGRLHSFALQSDGTLWAWGADFFQQLGDGGFMTQLRPIRVTMPGPVARIVASDYASAAVLADGSLWRWGYGAGPVFPSASVPTRVAGLPAVAEVALGFGHLVATTPGGDAWVLGANDRGQLGIGNLDGSAVPRANGLTGVTMLAANTATNFALLSDGSLRAWGSNIFATLGDGTKANRLAPVPAGGAGHYVAIAAGEYFGIALDDAGGVWQWGRNDAGQSGDGGSQQLTQLVQVPKLDHALGVSLTAKSGAVLKSDGTVWTLGGEMVPNLAGVAAVAIGSAHSAALKSDGTVWMWGANESGQLGNGTSTFGALPVAVAGATGAVAVDIGLDHTMMLKNDGSVWTWGGNNNYQLGDGTKAPRSVPVLSTVASEAVGIGAGYGFSVAIKPDGSVVRWGLNGTTLISGLGGIVAVAAGNNHVLAVKNDGTVWGWGDNTYGQLGLGNAGGYYTSGVQVPGLSGIIEVAAGATHSLARRNDGQVFAWGQNRKGALADGTATNRVSPVAVMLGFAARSIAAGDEVTALVKTDGTLWAAGDGVVFNWDEMALRKAAISAVTTAIDTDGDGMRDSWELAHFSSLSHGGAADSDGDGLTDIRESLVGADPLLADSDGDGTMDSADLHPLDYYDGIAPVLAIVAGDNQVAAPNQFIPLALDVGVWNHAGTEPLVNAPVTFAVTAGGGKLAPSIGGAVADTLTLRSDGDGSAQAFFQQPATAGVSSTIDVTAGQASVRFHSTSASPSPDDGPDSDQDGLPDSWELRYFATLDFGPADQFNSMDRTLLEYYQQGIAPHWATPAVATGLRAWYRSGDLYFYDENSGGMRTWADLSGNGFHLRQNDPEKQPQLYWSESGDSLVYFTEGQSLSTQTANILGGATDFTILVTFRPDSPARAARDVAAFGRAGIDGFQLTATDEHHALTWIGATTGVVQGLEIFATTALDQPQQMTVVKSGTTQTIYLNGQRVASGAVASAPRLLPGILTLGGSFNGGIIELQIFDRALPQSQREVAEDSLLDRAYLSDIDHNELGDRWERRYFGDIGSDPGADADGDGVSNRIEFTNGIDPTQADTDADGFTDGQELALGTDPKNPASRGAAQITWVSRQTSTSWTDEYTLPGPGLRGFAPDSTNFYKNFEWRLMRSGSPDADGTFTFTATMPDQEHPFIWRFDNQSGGHYEWHLFSPGLSMGEHGFIGWDVSPLVNARGNYLNRVRYYGGSSSERHISWSEPGFYADENGVVRSYNNDYSIELSSPSSPIDVPATSTSSEGGWEAVAPSGYRSGRNTTSAIYRLVVPAGTSGTAYWFEIFTPSEGDSTYTARSWDVSGEEGPEILLSAPAFDGSASVSPVFMNVGIMVDANRDGRIDAVGSGGTDATSPESPHRFWINDDDDDGPAEGNDIPGQSAAQADYGNTSVDSVRDLVDFFPVFLDIKQLLGVLPNTTEGIVYKLKHADEALNFVYTNKTRAEAFDFQKQILSTGFGPDFSQAAGVAAAQRITAAGVTLNAAFLDGIKNSDWGVILVEGRAMSAAPLRLVVEKNGTEIIELAVNIRISPVEDLFRHVDLTDAPKNYDGTVPGLPEPAATTRTEQPPNWPDSLTNGKYFVFVHGYNVDGQKARGWQAEVFKRMHALGAKARFVGVTWHGATGLDYHKAVFHAFQTGDAMGDALSFTGSAEMTVAAHSLGNVVVSHAIQSGGFRPARYFMINAAAPLEAYSLGDVGPGQVTNMTEEHWRSYDARLYAASWHTFFADSDYRSRLTWKLQFETIASAVGVAQNFYSAEEDVVANADENTSASVVALLLSQGFDFSLGAWKGQELVKGVDWTTSLVSLFMIRGQAGWGFNAEWNVMEPPTSPPNHGGTPVWRHRTPTEAAAIANEVLKTVPFFDHFMESGLLDPDASVASAKAAEAKVRYDLLARAIPAMSYPVAANPMPSLGAGKNFPMHNAGKADANGPFPTPGHKWRHSDFKVVALPYVFPMYEAMIERGNLK